MDPAWVFTRYPCDIPVWMRQQVQPQPQPQPAPAKEVKKFKKLEVRVVMCCSTCVEKVEDAVRGMHGVSSCKTDRWNDLLTIELIPDGGLNEEKLVKKLRRVTHGRNKVEILDSKSSSDDEKKSSSTSSTTTTVEYWNPYYGPGYTGGLVPWAPSSSASSSSDSPFITNPFYFQHQVGCGNCMGYPGAVCANCGRGSALGARFP